jgi:hypothetical protein
MSLAKSQLSPEALAHKWNRRFEVGQRVRYWTGCREGRGKESVTRSEASVLGAEPSRNYPGHTAVVWVEGESGCVALSHVEPIGAGL